MRLHKPYAGTKPAQETPGVTTLGVFPCAFCNKKFATLRAAQMHENSKHRKKLRRLMDGVK